MITLTAIKSFVSGNWRIALAVAILIFTAFTVGHCRGESEQAKLDKASIDAANVKALQQQQRADATAATQRITDVIAVSRQEQELRNAITATPDSAPDAARIALGCQRLRAAGHREADLPAICRSGGGAQTSATR